MTLQPQAVYTEPEDTARVARAAFPKGTLCLRLHDELGRLYADRDFATCTGYFAYPPVSSLGGRSADATIVVMQAAQDGDGNDSSPG